MFIDERPGSGNTASETLVWIKVLADLTKQESSSCSSVWGDMAGVSVLHSKEAYKRRGVLSGILLLNVITTVAAVFEL